MLNWIKTLTVITVSLAVATASFGVTFTVRKNGTGNFTTIQQALDSINYQDGVNDLVLIGPGVYDQQIIPNGDAGASSIVFPNIFNESLTTIEGAYASHTDTLTLRGEDPNDPPVITYLVGEDRLLQRYSVFPNNPADFFEAQLALVGNNVVFENLNIQMATQRYCINGQARGIVFNDCLFTNRNPQAQAHSSFSNYNNNIEITSMVNANVGADNETVYNNTIWDGLNPVDNSFHNSDGCYFHGYGEISGKPSTDPATVGFSYWNGNIFRNWRANIHVATHQSEAYRGMRETIWNDNFTENVRQMVNSRGHNGLTVINRNVFKLGGFTVLLAPTREPLERAFEITDRGSNGRNTIPKTVVIANNIFSGTTAQPQLRLHANSTNNALWGASHDWHVVNNTFHGYQNSAIALTGNLTSANHDLTLTIANNILSGDGGAAIGVNLAGGGAITTNLVNNGFFNNAGGDVVGTPTSNTGAITVNPNFDNTTITIPAVAGDVPVQGLNPANAAYLNSGNAAAYAAISAHVGNLDVDQTHTTANLDIGAQQNEPISVLDWSIY